jgi:tRNA (guanine-N7-)-methyltransferase
VDAPGFDVTKYFGRDAPLIVEIGCGIGEATAALAKARPDFNILAFEVWQPGVAETFINLEKAGVDNVRLISVDAVWSLEHLFGEASIAELWTFFPDPWPKKKQHRRRLVSPSIADLVATRLVPGGAWRIATDWPDYAGRIAEVLAAAPGLEGGAVERWQERPHTKFERRGLREGRPVEDFCVRRSSPTA